MESEDESSNFKEKISRVEDKNESETKTNDEKLDSDDTDKGKSEGKHKEKTTKKELDSEDKEDNSDKEDGDSDKEKEVPLLDQPLEKSGKRERKNVQRFNEEFATEPKETVCS